MPGNLINFPAGLSITSPIFRDLLNKLGGASGSQDIEVVSPLSLETVGDGQLLSILPEEDETVLIEVISATETDIKDSRGNPVQWEYLAREARKITDGYAEGGGGDSGGADDSSNGVDDSSSGTEGGSSIPRKDRLWVDWRDGWKGKAFNLIEARNTGKDIQGNGIDFDRASFPLNFKMRPVPAGTVLLAKMVSCIDPPVGGIGSELGVDRIGTEAWFGYENVIDGPSDHTFIVRVKKDGGGPGSLTTPCTWTYTVKDLNGGIPPLGEKMTPNVQRPPVGKVLEGDGLVGIGYYDVAGVFDLVSAGEVHVLETSPPPPGDPGDPDDPGGGGKWLFIVDVHQDGGGSGDLATPCTWTYEVKDLDAKALGAKETPSVQRLPVGRVQDGSGPVGIGYYTGGGKFVLFSAGEVTDPEFSTDTVLFVVNVYQDGGGPGDETVPCTWTYLVKDLGGDKLGDTMTPSVQRPDTGPIKDGVGPVGIGYYTDKGVFVLLSAGEIWDESLSVGLATNAFIVEVTQYGGEAGDAEDQCTWTYTVGGVGGVHTPNVQRPEIGAIIPGDGLVGIGMYSDSGVFDLISAGEVPDPAAC